jgi:hypothetical protein
VFGIVEGECGFGSWDWGIGVVGLVGGFGWWVWLVGGLVGGCVCVGRGRRGWEGGVEMVGL